MSSSVVMAMTGSVVNSSWFQELAEICDMDDEYTYSETDTDQSESESESESGSESQDDVFGLFVECMTYDALLTGKRPATDHTRFVAPKEREPLMTEHAHTGPYTAWLAEWRPDQHKTLAAWLSRHEHHVHEVAAMQVGPLAALLPLIRHATAWAPSSTTGHEYLLTIWYGSQLGATYGGQQVSRTVRTTATANDVQQLWFLTNVPFAVKCLAYRRYTALSRDAKNGTVRQCADLVLRGPEGLKTEATRHYETALKWLTTYPHVPDQ